MLLPGLLALLVLTVIQPNQKLLFGVVEKGDELVAFLPTIKLEFDPSQMYLCPKNRSALSPMKDFRITFSTKFRGGAPLISSHPTAEQRAKILLAVY